MSLLKLDQSGCEIESVPPLVKWAKSAHLPPLTPTSTFQRFDGGKTVQAHTDAAMREYGELCRKMALEEAAKVCEAIEREHLDTYKHKPGPNAYDPHFQGLSMGAGECAEKIGELLK